MAPSISANLRTSTKTDFETTRQKTSAPAKTSEKESPKKIRGSKKISKKIKKIEQIKKKKTK